MEAAEFCKNARGDPCFSCDEGIPPGVGGLFPPGLHGEREGAEEGWVYQLQNADPATLATLGFDVVVTDDSPGRHVVHGLYAGGNPDAEGRGQNGTGLSKHRRSETLSVLLGPRWDTLLPGLVRKIQNGPETLVSGTEIRNGSGLFLHISGKFCTRDLTGPIWIVWTPLNSGVIHGGKKRPPRA